ncbi:MAG: TrkH family potassium uptake protein [Oceanococcus sp.]
MAASLMNLWRWQWQHSYVAVQRVLGILLMVFSFTMLTPVPIALFSHELLAIFLDAFFVTFITGLIIWFPVRHLRNDLRLRDGFLIVCSFWVVLGIFGAIPFLVSPELDLSVSDAVFESVSGLTTTGATILRGIDEMPRGLLFYRQQLQWLGGMGIVVLAVAILPMLGVGGMQLYRAETPGPVKDNKLTPRITETAKALWFIYLGLTLICGLAYWFAGMSVFDAVGHAFSTVAIGGFSTHDASMAWFDSPAIEAVAIGFMFFSALNFGLHFTAWRTTNVLVYLRDPEALGLTVLLLLVSCITIAMLWLSGTYGHFDQTALKAVFQVVSIGTTTGFASASYASWPSFLPVMLLFISFVGGCAGSTAGGMKVIRMLLLIKQGMREVSRLIHPAAEFPVKLGQRAVSNHVVEAVWGFFSIYVAVFVFMLLLLMALGLDQVTAFSAVAACLNNLGPGLGAVAENFAQVPSGGKWVLVLAMLLGRLEIFTLLVLFTPTFWRR